MRYITCSYLNWPRNGEPSEFKVRKKCLTDTDLCSKMHYFHTLFSDFEIWWLTISMPVVEGKSYIPQKKALLPIVWKKFWNWKNFCHGMLQMSFSKGSAFSVKRAWPSLTLFSLGVCDDHIPLYISVYHFYRKGSIWLKSLWQYYLDISWAFDKGYFDILLLKNVRNLHFKKPGL